MQIDIYKHHHTTAFLGVPAGKPIPESWEGYRYFKSIDLLSGQSRIAMRGDAETILATIEAVGLSVM